MDRQTQGWPAVGWRESTWLPKDDGWQSRAQRMRNRGSFWYAVPAVIAELPVDLAPGTQELARSATSVIERFDESAAGWGLPFASVLLRSESASSSQIEQLSASARRIALASLGDRSSRNATSVAGNVEAMQAAVDLADRLDSDAILAMHERLGGGDDPDNAGKYRDQWVWIEGASPVTASFVAPRHEAIEGAVADLVAFLRRSDVEPLTQAAIAHAQFETIHPFTDGNGRTGRALVSAVLRRRGVATRMSAPISAGLLTDTTAYFQALTDYRGGDPEPIVEQFAQAAERAIRNSAVLHDDVLRVRQNVLDTAERKTANIRIMADVCASEPAFTADMIVARGLTRPTAYRLCERLVALGVLRRERSIGGVDAWTVVGLTDALDAFAQRAGRRTFNR